MGKRRNSEMKLLTSDRRFKLDIEHLKPNVAHSNKKLNNLSLRMII